MGVLAPVKTGSNRRESGFRKEMDSVLEMACLSPLWVSAMLSAWHLEDVTHGLRSRLILEMAYVGIVITKVATDAIGAYASQGQKGAERAARDAGNINIYNWMRIPLFLLVLRYVLIAY